MFYSGCEMIKEKPIRAKGQDIRTLPTYTIPEAAVFLAVNQRTLFSWYKGDEPILKASGNVGLVHFLPGFGRSIQSVSSERKIPLFSAIPSSFYA
jgi:hypothetical protein